MKEIDKLNFYIGFLDSFTKRGVEFLRENDLLSLRLTREWMIIAIKKLKKLSKSE